MPALIKSHSNHRQNVSNKRCAGDSRRGRFRELWGIRRSVHILIGVFPGCPGAATRTGRHECQRSFQQLANTPWAEAGSSQTVLANDERLDYVRVR